MLLEKVVDDVDALLEDEVVGVNDELDWDVLKVEDMVVIEFVVVDDDVDWRLVIGITKKCPKK
jgi:hypothetical protein